MSDKKPYRLSVKVIVINQEGRCLLLRRSPYSRANAGMWDLPGGKVETGESFDEALHREVEEETGLRIIITGVVGSSEAESDRSRIAYLLFSGDVFDGEILLSDGHDLCCWASLEETKHIDLIKHFKPVVRKCLKKHILMERKNS